MFSCSAMLSFLVVIFCCPEISLVFVFRMQTVCVHESNWAKSKWTKNELFRVQSKYLMGSCDWIKTDTHNSVLVFACMCVSVYVWICDADDAYLFISNFEHKSNFAAFTKCTLLTNHVHDTILSERHFIYFKIGNRVPSSLARSSSFRVVQFEIKSFLLHFFWLFFFSSIASIFSMFSNQLLMI